MQQMAKPHTLRIKRALPTAISAPTPMANRQSKKIALASIVEAGNEFIWPPLSPARLAALRAIAWPRCLWVEASIPPPQFPRFCLRNSDLGLLSGFGFRISDLHSALGSRPSDLVSQLSPSLPIS